MENDGRSADQFKGEHRDGYAGECHCGAIRVTIKQRPDFINDCNCSLCRNSGGVWGYFTGSDVAVTGDTQTYTRRDRTRPAVNLHFCGRCGATTHWTLTKAYAQEADDGGRMGVNMHLFHADQLSGVEVRFPDGENWNGTDDYEYRRAPIILGVDPY